jgi:hypothetical protein
MISGHEEMEGIGLTRSKTDSSIAYPLPEFQEARGGILYLTVLDK